MTVQKSNISIPDAIDLLTRAFAANDVSQDNAVSVATALVLAEAEGQVGHGFSRVSDYIAQAKTGKIQGFAIPKIAHDAPSAITIDAGCGFAYPALDLAIQEGTQRAADTGIASMSIMNSHHCGALSLQVEKIAQAGMIGIMMANAPAAIAPWGSNRAMFGTNPIAFSAPRPNDAPLVIDLSLSVVARGKVMNAKKTGQPIPEGWALDKDGNPTTDPVAALEGTMNPIGSAKGTALALMVEILSATLSGANYSTEMSSYFTADGPSPASGQFLLALKPQNSAHFADRLEVLLNDIADTPGARLPGTRRITAREAAHKNGLLVPTDYITQAQELAQG